MAASLAADLALRGGAHEEPLAAAEPPVWALCGVVAEKGLSKVEGSRGVDADVDMERMVKLAGFAVASCGLEDLPRLLGVMRGWDEVKKGGIAGRV